MVDELADALIPGECRADPDMTAAIPIPARSSARSRPYGYRSEGVRRDNRKPRNTTALVETSDRLWIASPSSPTDPVRTASSSSIRPVTARSRALTPTARLACRRSRVSSRRSGRGNAAAGSRRPEVLCTLPGPPERRRSGKFAPGLCPRLFIAAMPLRAVTRSRVGGMPIAQQRAERALDLVAATGIIRRRGSRLRVSPRDRAGSRSYSSASR